MSKLRIGVVGCGMGRGHITGFREHPDVEVVALADVDAEKLAATAAELSVAHTYTDAVAMFNTEKPDAVSIAVPNKFHKPLTLAALAAGCHVLCEKPMALNAVEAEVMLAAAQQAKRRLGINFSYRFRPQSMAMKRLIDAGVLGEIYYARSVWLRRLGMPRFGGWFGVKELAGGGPLIDLGVHRLDLALWLMGYPEPAWVLAGSYDKLAKPLAEASGKAFDVEDFTGALLKFKNGATLELDASWAGHIKEREQMSTRILGSKAGLYQYNINEGYEFELELYQNVADCKFDSRLKPPIPDCHSAYYSFADAIIKDEPFAVRPEDGVTVMRILDAIYRSAAENRPVQF